MNWYIKVFKDYAVFEGRARRKEFWMFALFHIIIVIALSLVDRVIGTASIAYGFGLLTFIYLLAAFIPGLAVTIRRLHDSGKVGWLALLALIPFVGGIIMLVLMVLSPTPGDNAYGPNPALEGSGASDLANKI